jgi:hypothetical protein
LDRRLVRRRRYLAELGKQYTDQYETHGRRLIEGASSAAIDANGAILTIGVPVMPQGHIHKIILDLLFG